MKKFYSFLLFAASVIALASFYSFAIGFATKNHNGITTAPGDLVKQNGDPETCAKCHIGNAFESSIEIVVNDADGHAILGYDPGATYDVNVIIHATGAQGYGFQMVGLIDGKPVGQDGMQNFPSMSNNVKEVTGILGRHYFEHNGVSASNTFSVKWVAPAAGTGSVTFYAVGNAVNANGSNSGDDPTNTKMTLTEGLLLANKNPFRNPEKLQLLSNPAQNEIQMTWTATRAGKVKMELFDLSGRRVASQTTPLAPGVNNLTLDVEELQNGVYILNATAGAYSETKKILVLR